MLQPSLFSLWNFSSIGSRLFHDVSPTKMRWEYSVRTPLSFIIPTTSSSASSICGLERSGYPSATLLQARGCTVRMPSYFAMRFANSTSSSCFAYMPGSYIKPNEPPNAPFSIASSTSRISCAICSFVRGVGS